MPAADASPPRWRFDPRAAAWASGLLVVLVLLAYSGLKLQSGGALQ
ncbi:MAG: hypothetical protein JSR41_07410 [Proteobacteria bacterium]|nr:hypothetical protein [Pseudomonadota bacterium]